MPKSKVLKYILTFNYKPNNNFMLGQLAPSTPYRIFETLAEVKNFINEEEIKNVSIYEVTGELRVNRGNVKLVEV